mgnify:CR=1 FL=1
MLFTLLYISVLNLLNYNVKIFIMNNRVKMLHRHLTTNLTKCERKYCAELLSKTLIDRYFYIEKIN